MGRFTRTRTHHRKKAEIPLCIFPRGKKAGIRCISLSEIKVGGRTVKLCDEKLCVYYEATEDHELGLGYVGVEV